MRSLETKKLNLEKVDETIRQLDQLILVIIIASEILGFIVLYNLIYIRLLDRVSKIAVSGTIVNSSFKVSLYVFKENIILLLVAIILSIFTGRRFYKIIMSQIELEFIKYPTINYGPIYVQSILLTTFMFIVVPVILHFRIKKLMW